MKRKEARAQSNTRKKGAVKRKNKAARKKTREQRHIASHDIIANIEREVGTQMNINLVIHMDPVVIDDEPTNRLREQVQQIVTDIDPQLSMHDFRAVFGPTHTNLVFDIAVPPAFSLSDSELEQLIERRAKEMGSYFCVITIDHNYAYLPHN